MNIIKIIGVGFLTLIVAIFLKDVKKDLVDTIGESHFVSKKEAMPKLLKSAWQAVLRLFAPLM